MIQATRRTEAEYRAIEVDSSSSLKDFAADRKKYYRKYILGESLPEDEEESKAATMGRMVETLELEPELFESRFYMSTCPKTPTGKMLDFCNALYKHTMLATDEGGVVTRPFMDIAMDARAEADFSWGIDRIMNIFQEGEGESYYREMRETKPFNKTVVTVAERETAESIRETLRSHRNTAAVMNLRTADQFEVHNQLQIENYSIDSLPLKSMLDKLIINHETKKARIYDLKVIWGVERFYREYYLQRKAYIQAVVYYYATKAYLEQRGLTGYEVLPPAFIVADSINYYAPLIYKTSVDDIREGQHGFTYQERYYPGVDEILADLKWAKENSIWNISRTNYENQGICKLK
jgi:hypothetical protein